MSTMYFILLCVALIPAIIMMVYVYKQDKVEHEPIGLIVKLIILGCVSALPSMVLELIGEKILNTVGPGLAFVPYQILDAFLVVALVEEGMKLLFCYLGSWRNPAFDFKFDGVVYSVSVSIGFAALENVLYVFQNGLGTGISRAFLSIPGHVSFAVLAGIFYARAKMCAKEGNLCGKNVSMFIALLSAVLLHGFYDASLFISSMPSILIFIVVMVIVYIIVIRVVKKEARKDAPI